LTRRATRHIPHRLSGCEPVMNPLGTGYIGDASRRSLLGWPMRPSARGASPSRCSRRHVGRCMPRRRCLTVIPRGARSIATRGQSGRNGAWSSIDTFPRKCRPYCRVAPDGDDPSAGRDIAEDLGIATKTPRTFVASRRSKSSSATYPPVPRSRCRRFDDQNVYRPNRRRLRHSSVSTARGSALSASIVITGTPSAGSRAGDLSRLSGDLEYSTRLKLRRRQVASPIAAPILCSPAEHDATLVRKRDSLSTPFSVF